MDLTLGTPMAETAASRAEDAEQRPASDRPMRILRVIARLNIGGPAIHTLLLTQQLHGPRYDSMLVTGVPEPGEGEMIVALPGQPMRRINIPWLRQRLGAHDVLAWWRVFQLIRREKPDIVHTHTAKAGALGRSAAWISNALERFQARAGRRPAATCRIVHTFHGHVLQGYFAPWVSWAFMAIERWLAKRTDVLIAVSRAVRDELLEKGIGRPGQWRIVPLGLELSTFAALPLPEPGDRVRVGLVGRLVPIKNPSLFLEAVQRAHGDFAGAGLCAVVVGDGPLRRPLEREVHRLGLEHLIRFTGWRQDLERVYGEVDIACLTSWSEGTPVALIEAMAAGRAVIATDVGGVRELLGAADGPAARHAERGFEVAPRGLLVRGGDAEGFAAALTAVAQDGGLRRRLGSAGRAYVLERFSVGRLVRDITQLYEALHCAMGPSAPVERAGRMGR